MATKEDTKNFKELLGWIEDGWYDSYIPQIIEALKSRQQDSIKVGDKVVVNNTEKTSRSKYSINGSEAVVEKVNSKTVTVRLTKLSEVAKKSGVASVGGRWQLTTQFVSLI